MYRQILILKILLLASLLCSVQAQSRETPVTWSLKNLSTATNLSRGDRFTIELIAKIDDGWHLYATTQTSSDGPRPTRITLPEGQPFNLLNLAAPKPTIEYDNNFKAETAWYSGTVSFRLTIAVSNNGPTGQQVLRIQTYFQSCTKEKCLAPRQETLSLPIAILAPKNPAPTAAFNLAEEKSYRAANSISDPVKRIAALEKFLSDYPQATISVLAHRTILELLVQNFPAQKEKIFGHANALIDDSATETARGSWLNLIATLFVNAGIFLPEAESFAEKSLALSSDQGGSSTGTKLPREITLGRIYLKRGQMNEGEKLIAKAYEADAKNPAALIGMGEIAELKTDRLAALNYYSSAYLTGLGGLTARKKTEAIYRQLYPDKIDQIEDWLDNKYRRLYPSPIKIEPYRPSSQTTRVVLAEVFTGANCGPCLGADLAFEALMERFSFSNLAVLMHHVHIPTPDPMGNPSSEARKLFYQVHAAPAPFIDGVFQAGLGGNREQAQAKYEQLKSVIEKSLSIPAQADIMLSASQKGRVVKVKAELANIKSDNENLRLHLALVEDQIRYTGMNGIRFHALVVRAMAGDNAKGFSISPRRKNSIEQTFDLDKITGWIKSYLDDYEANGPARDNRLDEKKFEVTPNRLSIVAFIQDSQSKQVLQAAMLKLQQNQ